MSFKTDINFPQLTSDGTSGPDWLYRLEKQGVVVSEWAKGILCHESFSEEIHEGRSYDLNLLDGNSFDAERFERQIRRNDTGGLAFNTPAEVGPLVADWITSGILWDMPSWGNCSEVVIPHRPVKLPDEEKPTILAIKQRVGQMEVRLGAYYVDLEGWKLVCEYDNWSAALLHHCVYSTYGQTL
jgi:hypothetical protein